MPNPALLFAVRNVTFTPTVTGYLVTVYTNNPAHLFMRWTETIPQKHVNKTIVRGAPVGTYIDQCFVVFTDTEQNELGDTWTHTFTLDNWTYCQTRWFYFWGTVGGVLSPSASCILKHHSTIYPFMDFYSDQDSGGDSVDGRVARVLAGQSWLQIHSGPGNQSDVSGATTAIHIRAGVPFGTYESIHRSILTFPTAPLGAGAQVQAVTLRLYCTVRLVDPGWSASIGVFGASPAAFNNLQNSDYGCVWSILRSNKIDIMTITPNSYFELSFNALGLPLVNPTGPTELSLREANYDAPYNAPNWIMQNDAYCLVATADHATPAYRPRLRVYYLPG